MRRPTLPTLPRAIALAVIWAAMPGPVHAASLPEIRASAANPVPACVTPDGLMRFLRSVNDDLDDKHVRIAHDYRDHGRALGVRWDYAFFQMVLETNYLRFRRGSGRMGDAKPRQNNFAGLGTTGGGVPGESFPDVSTGVRAQLEHLVAYSGHRIERPVARRTAENQDHIIKRMQKLGRPVRFSDLQMRWAIDRGYAAKIASIAERYRDGGFCDGRQAPELTASTAAPVSRSSATASAAIRPAVPMPVVVHTGRLSSGTR